MAHIDDEALTLDAEEAAEQQDIADEDEAAVAAARVNQKHTGERIDADEVDDARYDDDVDDDDAPAVVSVPVREPARDRG